MTLDTILKMKNTPSFFNQRAVLIFFTPYRLFRVDIDAMYFRFIKSFPDQSINHKSRYCIRTEYCSDDDKPIEYTAKS